MRLSDLVLFVEDEYGDVACTILVTCFLVIGFVFLGLFIVVTIAFNGIPLLAIPAYIGFMAYKYHKRT